VNFSNIFLSKKSPNFKVVPVKNLIYVFKESKGIGNFFPELNSITNLDYLIQCKA
jgi:hypothetical protein